MLTKQKTTWILELFFVVSCCAALYAQRDNLVHLGDAHVDGARDSDSIKVGRSRGTFRAIQLRVSGGAVNFDRVVVRYGNGTQDEVAVRNRIPDGGKTRIIDLPGERRIIQSVDLWYSKDNWRRRPKVSLYGVR